MLLNLDLQPLIDEFTKIGKILKKLTLNLKETWCLHKISYSENGNLNIVMRSMTTPSINA